MWTSSGVFAGFGLARLLGFLFSVASARALGPADFGRMSYALTVAGIAGVFVTTAPTGLARFLSRNSRRPADRDAFYSNWLAVAAAVLAGSAALSLPYSAAMGLSWGMAAGVLVNLAGVAALEMFREVERGLDRFTTFSVYYVLANLLQLAAVLALAAAGRASAELFVAVYGASGLAALLLTAAVTPVGVKVDLRSLSRRRMLQVGRFIRPILLQSICWNVWFFADVVLVQHLRTPVEVGNYAAGKAIANGFGILPSAIVYVLVPGVARLAVPELRAYLLRALVLTAGASAPVLAGALLFSGQGVRLIFGGRYPLAAEPASLLVVGMVVFGLKAVIGAAWLGLGHPVVETICSFVAMVVTLASGLLLIPEHGLAGAAWAFLLGALAQLAAAAAITIWALASDRPRIAHLEDQAILEAAGADG